MRENILSFVNGIRELRELYQNDNTFRKCIDEAVVNQMDIQSALIFTMVRGYEVKNNIKNNYKDYIENVVGK